MSAYAIPGLLFPPIILPVASSGSALPRPTEGVECGQKDSEVWLPDKYCCNSRDGHGACLSAPSWSKSSCAPAVDVGGDTRSELTLSPCSPSPTRRPVSLSTGSERLGHTPPKAPPSLSCQSPQAPAKFTLSGRQQVANTMAERSADLDGYFDPGPCPDPDRAVGDWDIQILSAKIDPMRLIGSRTVAARPSAHRSTVLASSQSPNKVESEPSSPSTLPDPDAGFSDQKSTSSNSSTSYTACVFFGRKDTASHDEARDDDDPYDYSSSDDDDDDSDHQKPAFAPSLSSSLSPPPLSASFHSHSVTPHDDAIQFEIYISYNGRTYSATRTLAHFVRLRIDLIEEYTRQQFLSGTNARNNNSATCGNTSNNHNYNYSGGPRRRTPRMPNSNEQSLHNRGECHDGNFNQVGSVGRTTTTNNNNSNNIPQLPPLDGGNGSGGAGQGFTMLCALTHSYVPHIERWIRTVAHIVPPSTSPTLATFLWEPISNNKHKIGMAVEGQNKRESSNWNVNKGMEDSGVSPKKKLSAAGVTGSINGGGGGGVCSRESKKTSCPFYRKGSSNTLDSIEEDASDEEEEEEEEEEDKEDKEEVIARGRD